MVESAYKDIIPVVPAFLMYERSMVEWLGGINVYREGQTIETRVEYAGGEKAVRAIESITQGHQGQNRNDRLVQPLVTIKMIDVQYNIERYHPPESQWSIVWNAPNRETATSAARVAKPAPYKVSYEWQFHALFEEDLRFMMHQAMNRFHHHGGLDYLRIQREDKHTEFFPLHLRGFNVLTDSNTGEEDRMVRAIMLIELEAYLPLPYRMIPIFRTYIQHLFIRGEEQSEGQIMGPGYKNEFEPISGIPVPDNFIP